MSWSWKTVGYWATLAANLIITGYCLLPLLTLAVLNPQYFWNEPEKFLFYFVSGTVSLACFALYFRERGFYSMKKWYPIKFDLGIGLDGLPGTDSCHAPSPIRLKATQINRLSDSDPKDYSVELYESATKKAVFLDRSKSDHDQLYRNFLFGIHDFGREFLPRPYSSRWNIIPDPARK